MKEISELHLPEDVFYSKEHEWVRKEGDTVKIGISDYAQDQLGDIVFVEMPEVGDSFNAGEEFGTLESVKAVSEIYLPVGGEIVAINEELEDEPEKINQQPDKAWIVEVRPSDMAELDNLLNKADYLKILEAE
ncbi:MAG: glycine cleavage system protein H [Desulfobacterales bacterium]|nr:MAG: glycine cleavage system protein H [Desulfobacterales bacterium]